MTARVLALVSISLCLAGINVLCLRPRRHREGHRWLARMLLAAGILGLTAAPLFH